VRLDGAIQRTTTPERASAARPAAKTTSQAARGPASPKRSAKSCSPGRGRWRQLRAALCVIKAGVVLRSAYAGARGK
jgi:hypothetical protein